MNQRLTFLSAAVTEQGGGPSTGPAAGPGYWTSLGRATVDRLLFPFLSAFRSIEVLLGGSGIE